MRAYFEHPDMDKFKLLSPDLNTDEIFHPLDFYDKIMKAEESLPEE